MKPEYNTYAYFWVSDFDCEPNDISELLWLKPTEIQRKGDLISEKSGRKRRQSSWKYHSSLPRTEPSQDAHLKNILDVIQERKEVITTLKTMYSVGINCVGFYYNANPGFHMSSELLKACASLEVDIDFDLYNGDGILEL